MNYFNFKLFKIYCEIACSILVNSPVLFGASSLITGWAVCSSVFLGSSEAGASSIFWVSVTSAVTVVSSTILFTGWVLSWGACSAGASAGILGCSWTTSVV